MEMERLCRTELPRLWLPKREDLHVIESIPTLGTGKVDLRAVRQLALDLSPLTQRSETVDSGMASKCAS